MTEVVIAFNRHALQFYFLVICVSLVIIADNPESNKRNKCLNF